MTTTRARVSTRPLYVMSFILLALIGAIHLPFPFHGDHAMFATAAVEISEGGGLYTDFWDIKQPGIFLFFVAAGDLFGYSEFGVHLFELIYWLVFSAVLLATMGRKINNPVFAALLPVLSVGTYYAVSGSQQLTQLEALAAFPIFASMWLAYRASDSARPFLMLVGSGIAGGVAMVFKLLFVVLLVPLWMRAVAERSSKAGKTLPRSTLEVAIGVGVGTLIPLGLVVAQLSKWGALSLAIDTFFRVPPRILAELQSAPLGRLARSVAFFLQSYGPMLILAIAGAWMLRRSAVDRLAKYLWSWCLFGAVVIVMQRQSWWSYHFHLIGFPVALLAVLTLDRLWMQRVVTSNAPSRKTKAAFLVLVAFLALPALLNVAQPTLFLVQHRLALNPTDRFEFQDRYSNGDYSGISQEVEFLKGPDSRKGDIYVAGDPLYYWLSGRGQATALNGWALEFFLDEQWHDLAGQLESSGAPYVFVSQGYANLIERRGDRFAAVLELRYEQLRTSDLGTWYELVGSDAASANAYG